MSQDKKTDAIYRLMLDVFEKHPGHPDLHSIMSQRESEIKSAVTTYGMLDVMKVRFDISDIPNVHSMFGDAYKLVVAKITSEPEFANEFYTKQPLPKAEFFYDNKCTKPLSKSKEACTKYKLTSGDFFDVKYLTAENFPYLYEYHGNPINGAYFKFNIKTKNFDINLDLKPGTESIVLFEKKADAVYKVRCTPHGDNTWEIKTSVPYKELPFKIKVCKHHWWHKHLVDGHSQDLGVLSTKKSTGEKIPLTSLTKPQIDFLKEFVLDDPNAFPIPHDKEVSILLLAQAERFSEIGIEHSTMSHISCCGQATCCFEDQSGAGTA